MKRLLDLRIANEITADKYASTKTAIERERDILESSIESLRNEKDDEKQRLIENLSFAEALFHRFDTGGMDDRREILRNLGSKHTLKDGILSVEIEKPLLRIEELKKDKNI